jgi:predicted nucleic acid-binding protein
VFEGPCRARCPGDRDDCWIATAAIAHGLPLVSHDDDVDDVPGLQLVKP